VSPPLTPAGAASGAFARARLPRLSRRIVRLGQWLTAAVLLLVVLVMVGREARDRRDDAVSDLRTVAALLATNSEAAVAFGSEDDARELLASLRASPDVMRARLETTDGRVLATYAAPQADALSCEGFDPTLTTDLRWCGVRHQQPVVRHRQPLGTLVVESSLRGTWRAMGSTVVFSMLLAVAAFALSVPLWRRLAERVTDPLDKLTGFITEVSEHEDFSRRVDAGADSAEVELLAQSFNHLLDQLAQRDLRVSQELTQRRHAEQRLAELAYVDGVTGLKNRHHFMERIEKVLGRAARGQTEGALLYIDLDGFKGVNDRLGHDQGDELLREVGNRLTASLRGSDEICRLGGDEFAIIIEPAHSRAQIDAVAGKLVAELSRPYQLSKGLAEDVSASIGVCRFPDHGTERATLLRRADAAMYAAKSGGKRRHHHHDPAETTGFQ
jgi:diguanylate cyclase (GGDEF)-like protein